MSIDGMADTAADLPLTDGIYDGEVDAVGLHSMAWEVSSTCLDSVLETIGIDSSLDKIARVAVGSVVVDNTCNCMKNTCMMAVECDMHL